MLIAARGGLFLLAVDKRSRDAWYLNDRLNRMVSDGLESSSRPPAARKHGIEAARRFYEEDLKSGFVRLQAELWAASLANEALREKFLPRLPAWKKLVLGGVREAMAVLAANGTSLPAPLTAEVIACWISEFWLGMEFADLLGAEEEQSQLQAALEAVQ